MISILDRKLWRDLWRIWAQVLAIALVMACGVATIVVSLGVLRSLEETRGAFYDRYRFGTVFASLVRAPARLGAEIAAIPGVSGVELRIVRPAVLDMEAMPEPATALVTSLPDRAEPRVSRLYVRAGRLPDPDRIGEVAVSEQFARAHGLVPGSHFRAVLNGDRRTLTVTGVVLSPEYVFTIGPGDMAPDPRRFGVLFMPERQMAGLFDMAGVFNDVTLRTQRGADLQGVIDRLDVLLDPWGGAGAHGRADQLSHAFLDSELTQLRAMANIIPPVFLFVSAFLVNMILSRLITLEREQIGLLKAIGYGTLAVGWHYAKLVLVVALLGTAIGAAFGAWAGPALTRLYGEYYAFPFLVMRHSLDLYALAAAVTGAAALAGAARAIWRVLALPAAIAMQPPAPIRYRRLFAGGARRPHFFSQLTTMALRNMLRHPVRTGFTLFSVALSLALTIGANFSFDSISVMIDTIYYRAERQDATLYFAGERAPAALGAVARLPGVLASEPLRGTDVVLRNGHRERQLFISGWTPGTRLAQVLDTAGTAVTPPSDGLMISEHLAEILGLATGDLAEVELVDQQHRIVSVPVTGIVQSLIGLTAYMDAAALDRLLGRGPRLTGARLLLDPLRLPDFYAAVKATPSIGAVALLAVSRRLLEASMDENVLVMTSIYSGLAMIITFGVIYNAARIQLSERARELASLRVLGFTRAEVFRVLLVELALVLGLAQPVGWALGWFFCWLVAEGFKTDLFRIPFVIETSTYALGSGLVFIVGIVSALVVRRRVQRLDLIAVLKTRD